MSDPCFLGVDIGGTKVLAVLTDRHGTPLAEHQEPTETNGGAVLADQILAISATLGAGQKVAAIGVGLPASVDPATHALTLIPNIAEMEGTDFHRLLTERLGVPVLLENDVNAAALAEAQCGDAADPLAFIAIGTGIGMGVVVNGHLVRGRAGGAGEIALLPIVDAADSPLTPAAFERRLGGSGWRSAYEALGGGAQADLVALFAQPDAAFQSVIAAQADLLARALLTISAVIAPEVFVFGGSIGGQPRLIAAVEQRLPHYFAHPPKLRASSWGNRAGAVGAAIAAAETIKDEP